MLEQNKTKFIFGEKTGNHFKGCVLFTLKFYILKHSIRKSVNM